MNTTYLLLGSNMGNSKTLLSKARLHIEKHIGSIWRESSIYATAAWGNINQNNFLNQVIIIHTKLNAAETMSIILDIEKKLGRIRTIKNAPRVIDIDILFFNKEIINTINLKIPHPQIQNRNFVLIPCNQLSPNLKHPVLNKTIHQLLRDCPDKLSVSKL